MDENDQTAALGCLNELRNSSPSRGLWTGIADALKVLVRFGKGFIETYYS